MRDEFRLNHCWPTANPGVPLAQPLRWTSDPSQPHHCDGISGDAGTWTRTHEGRTISEDNPVLLANRKAKALSSLLKAQQAVKKVRVPWLDALVFLSADNLQCELSGPAANRVVLKDLPAEESRPGRKGVSCGPDESRRARPVDPDCRSLIDNKVAKALAWAIEQAR